MSPLSIVMCSGTALLVTGITQTLLAPNEEFRLPARRAARALAASAAAAIIFALGGATIRPAGISTAITGAATLLALLWGRSDFIYWRMLRTVEAPTGYATFDLSNAVEPPIKGASAADHAEGKPTCPLSPCDGIGSVGTPRSAQVLQRARPRN